MIDSHRIAGLSVILACCFLSAGYSHGQTTTDLTPVTVQLKWYHQFQFAGFYVAKINGYYRQAGLDVTIRAGEPAISPIRQVIDRQADFGVSDSSLLLAAMEGEPVVALAAVGQHSPLVLLVKDDGPVHSPHDLVGRTVMMGEGLTDIELVAMFQAEGVPIEQIRRAGYTLDPAQLNDPQIAALAGYLSNTPYLLDQAGIAYRTINPLNYGIDFYSEVIFTRRQLAEQHPELVGKFTQATMRGWQFAFQHPEQTIDLILSHYHCDKSREHLMFEAQALKQIVLPQLVEPGHMNPGRWQKIAEHFNQLGLTDHRQIPPGFLWQPEPAIPWYRRQLRTILFGLLLTVATLTGLILAYSFQLKRAIRIKTEDLHHANTQLHQEMSRRQNIQHELIQAQAIAQLGNWTWDRPTGQWTGSVQLAHMFQCPPDQFDESALRQKIHPDDLSKLDQALQRDNQSFELVIRLTLQSRLRHVKVIGQPVCNEQGRNTSWFGTMQDITDSFQADQQRHLVRQLVLEVAAAKDMQLTATGCLKAVMTLAHMDAGALLIENEYDQRLNLVCHRNLAGPFVEQHQQINVGHELWHHIHNHGPLDADAMAAWIGNVNQSTGENLKSMTILPLRYGQIVFGCILLGSHERHDLHRSLRNSVEQLIDQIAGVIKQKHAEQINQQHRRQLDLMTRAFPACAVILVDQRWRLLEVFGQNPAILHLDNPQHQPQSLDQLPELIDRPELLEALSGLWENDNEHSCELTLADRILQLHATTLQQSHPDSARMLITLFDITNRRTIELRLAESERKYRQLFESIQLGIVHIDAKGLIIESNPAFAKMLRCNPQQLHQTPLVDLISPTHADDLERTIIAEQLEQRGYTDELTRNFRDQQGHAVPATVRFWRQHNPENRDPIYWGIIRNLSQQIEQENQLAQYNQQLEQANRELIDFVNIIGHDLQEPVRKIRTFAERLDRACCEHLDARGRNYLDRLCCATDRMQAMMNDLLVWSGVTASSLDIQPVDLNLLLQQVVSDLETRIDQVHAKLQNQTLPTIHADPTCMRQLLTNLLVNALKYHHPDRTPVIELQCQQQQDRIQLTITDNGIGIPDEHLERIFTVFQRLHSKDEYPGNGIGLSICRKIAIRHGGQIKAVPHQHGARFVIELPTEPKATGIQSHD